MSKFTESMIGTDWHSQDIATSTERTSPRVGIALVIASAFVSFVSIVGWVYVLWLVLS